MRAILSLITMLTCPDYGQAMSNEFYVAAPSCSFIDCDDSTMRNLHAYTSAIRTRAGRQTDRCFKEAMLGYADHLDREAKRQRSEWEEMRLADQQRLKIKK